MAKPPEQLQGNKNKPCLICNRVRVCPYSGRCRSCYKKQYYSENREICLERTKNYNKKCPEKYELWKRKSQYRRRYGIEFSDVKKMFENQKGLCAICACVLPRWSEIHGLGKSCLDHCHKSKKVRGVLCRKCNLCLGFSGDRAEVLELAAKYLRKCHNEEYL